MTKADNNLEGIGNIVAGGVKAEISGGDPTKSKSFVNPDANLFHLSQHINTKKHGTFYRHSLHY